MAIAEEDSAQPATKPLRSSSISSTSLSTDSFCIATAFRRLSAEAAIAHRAAPVRQWDRAAPGHAEMAGTAETGRQLLDLRNWHAAMRGPLRPASQWHGYRLLPDGKRTSKEVIDLTLPDP
ncbi:hypothetical protein IEN52_11830 [Stenotrophomonas rhizophila]|nr:hypothetical protein [Stenotrophomonas rhizophila]